MTTTPSGLDTPSAADNAPAGSTRRHALVPDPVLIDALAAQDFQVVTFDHSGLGTP